MKHIRLFENFDDHLDPYTREIFGLFSEIEVIGSDFSLVGPSDNPDTQKLAQKIADRLTAQLTDAYETEYDHQIERDRGEKKAEQDAHIAMWDLSQELMKDEDLKEELAAIGYSIKRNDE